MQHTDAIKVQTGDGSSIVVLLEALTSMGVVLKGEDLAANRTAAVGMLVLHNKPTADRQHDPDCACKGPTAKALNTVEAP